MRLPTGSASVCVISGSPPRAEPGSQGPGEEQEGREGEDGKESREGGGRKQSRGSESRTRSFLGRQQQEGRGAGLELGQATPRVLGSTKGIQSQGESSR